MSMAKRKVPIWKGGNPTKAIICIGVIIILLLLPLVTQSPYYLHILILTFIYIIATSSLRTIAISGQLSLGHAGFMSIGAYVSAVLAKQLGWTPWLTIPLGGLATTVVAVLIGYPFSRLRAIYFSMVSLFFGVAILAVNTTFDEYTGGYAGLMGISPLFAGSKLPYYYCCFVLVLLSLLALHRFEVCRIGMTIKTVAQSDSVASSVGINESNYRVLALAVGCFFVGIAGAVYAHYNLVLSHSTFNLLASINLLIYMLVGGVGSFFGPLIGTVTLIIIPELFREIKEFVPYIYSGIMLIMIFLMPQGIASLPGQVQSWVAKCRERKTVGHAS
jgi:branched-chain amino acid transport system permease protein